MEFTQVKELIQMLEASSLREMHVTLGGDSVYLSKNAAGFATVFPENEERPEVSVILPEPNKEDKQSGEPVLSPLVGTFFASAAPEKPPFVKAGDAVKAGQVLCIVEAMKVMNEITAKRDGVVTEILAANGQLVEYNQPLMRIV